MMGFVDFTVGALTKELGSLIVLHFENVKGCWGRRIEISCVDTLCLAAVQALRMLPGGRDRVLKEKMR